MKKPSSQTRHPNSPMVVESADGVSFTVTFTGGCALAVRLAAIMQEQSLEEYIAVESAAMAASAVADTVPDETPAWGELFGLEPKGAKE